MPHPIASRCANSTWIRRIVGAVVRKPLPRPLGRWGVAPERALGAFDAYDHSCCTRQEVEGPRRAETTRTTSMK